MQTPRTVILWTNGVVTVFDEAGFQVNALQGRIDKVRPLLAGLTDLRIDWRRGDYEPWMSHWPAKRSCVVEHWERHVSREHWTTKEGVA